MTQVALFSHPIVEFGCLKKAKTGVGIKTLPWTTRRIATLIFLSLFGSIPYIEGPLTSK